MIVTVPAEQTLKLVTTWHVLSETEGDRQQVRALEAMKRLVTGFALHSSSSSIAPHADIKILMDQVVECGSNIDPCFV